MTPSFRNSDIIKTYRDHPLRLDTILARITRRRGSLDGITELDLAIDDTTQITDQNHVGGTGFVETLGNLVNITERSLVLDLGSGLGGSARYLAWKFGCRVHGIDLSSDRNNAANKLTALVGLTDLVTLECADFAGGSQAGARYDVLWGQGSWVHVEDKEAFLKSWVKALRKNGRVALEEAYLRSPPPNGMSSDLLELEQIWHSRLIELDEWIRVLTNAGIALQVVEDLSQDLINHYQKMIAIGPLNHSQSANAAERKSWQLGVQLARNRVVGYFRIVGTRS